MYTKYSRLCTVHIITCSREHIKRQKSANTFKFVSTFTDFTMTLIVPLYWLLFVNLQMALRGLCGNNLLQMIPPTVKAVCVSQRRVDNPQKPHKEGAADDQRKFHSLALLSCLSQFLSESLFKILQLLLGHTQQTADMSDQNSSPGIIMSYRRRIKTCSLHGKQDSFILYRIKTSLHTENKD